MTLSQHHTAYITQLLYDLESVEESLPHHPEENALLHSLQAFEIALHNSKNPVLIAAALLHDIGKSQALPMHAALGAEMLRGRTTITRSALQRYAKIIFNNFKYPYNSHMK